MRLTRLLGITSCIVLAAVPALAQVQAGRIVGIVYDPDRAVVPGTTVTVTNTETNIPHVVTTNATGNFVVTPLNPGIYEVSASLEGFQTVVERGIEISVGQSVRVDLRLPLGETTTIVEVTSSTPLLETESGTAGQVLSNRQIVDLPLNGRGFHELARLTPGAASVTATGNVLRIRPEVVNSNTISGVRGSQITFLLDGVDVTEQHQGGTYIQASIDALQEFSVQQNAYSAEYSRAGGFFNATTKSGTNAFHGTLFEFLRNDKLDARGFFAQEREVLKRNQYGGAIGGPIIRDKTFFFFNYEAMRERVGLLFNNHVPTLAMRAGDFGASNLSRIYDPLSTAPNPSGSGSIRTPFANNRIPGDRLSQQALFFNPFIDEPNSGADRAIFAPSRAVDTDQFTLRVDHRFQGGTALFGRLSWHDNRMQEPNPQQTLGVVPLKTDAQNVAIGVNNTFSPTVINEFRFNLLPSLVDLAPYLDNRNFNDEAGITGLEGTLRRDGQSSFPDFIWTGYASLRGSNFDQRPKTQDRIAYEFIDNLTWIKNNHVLKFGTKIRFYEWLGTDGRTYAGVWNFNGINTENPSSSAGTGDPFADWMLGYPSSGARGFPGDTFGGNGTYWHFFVDDDYKITPRLTLNLGLRYEYTPWMKGYRGQLGTFDPSKDRPIIIASETDQIDLGAQLAAPVAYEFFQDAIQTSSQAGLPIQITENDKTQFAPRFGFAWRPLGDRTVLRGGYGIFYESEGTSGRLNLNMIPFSLGETVFNTRGQTPNRTLSDFFLGNPIGAPTAAGMNPSSLKDRQGYNQHWNFGVQQQLNDTLMFDVSYVGNRGNFIGSRFQLNIPEAGPGAIQARRPFPRFGSINYYQQGASNIYHSLQGKLEQRLSRGAWYLLSYTFSKSLEHVPAIGTGGKYAWEYGPSSINVPHNFAASFGYELPFGRGKPLLSNAGGVVNGLLGGWQLQGLVSLRSGLGYTPSIGRDVANIGSGGQRPNRLASGEIDSPTLDRWFDTSAFVVPANFTYGNSGVNILTGDMMRVYDFSILKNFQPTDGTRVQFRAEFFNLPNTPSFNNPSSNIESSQRGRVTSTRSQPRQIQFGLKFNF